MTIESTTTLRPGLLVSLSTSVTGNINYSREITDEEHRDEQGRLIEAWETTRAISDPEEYERAIKVRSKVRSLISSACVKSAFGLLCPEDQEDLLKQKVAEARKVADEFNEGASLTRVKVYVLTGKIASNDAEAIEALNSEVAGLMAEMQEGLRNVDVTAIRAAANKAKQMGNMLSADAQARIQIAIDAARETAKEIVKAGETAAVEVDMAAIKRIAEQRTAFVEVDDAGLGEVGKVEVAGRGIDLGQTEIGSVAAAGRQIELD